jgi:hypothetical protein
MKCLILAVFLAIVQTGPPVPRQAPDKPASTGNRVKQESETKQDAAGARTTTTAESNEGEGQGQTTHNAGETVIIRESAAMARSKDWWDKAYVIATITLVAVGACGVRYAIKTVKAMNEQTAELQKSVTGINRQAQLMEGGIYVDSVRMIEFEETRYPICLVKIANSGPIAQTVSISMNLRLANQITHYRRDQIISIPAHGAHKAFILSRRSLNIGELSKVECGVIPLRVYGLIKTARKEEIPYCYKYTQWAEGSRPRKLPPFVTCDFDTETAMSGIAEVVGVGATAQLGQFSAGTATVENPPPSDEEESSDPN